MSLIQVVKKFLRILLYTVSLGIMLYNVILCLFTSWAIVFYCDGYVLGHCITFLYCLTACLYAKCCNLIGWIMKLGPSIHFRIDGPDRLYGFRSKLKQHFWGDDRETINRSLEKLVTFGKLSVNFRKPSGKT